ncbi:MBL fold metallo-hydrolase [Aquihabitans sp. G128]|uniref:MBL fold metallo-hydrolase n=1 Tax=Aquihabitans sp. G128 TaxID=2849779 RepID=UPI001C230662|nr:MBL fold metallo-hydrolase [Aquihabitans sp. G128]QXC59661.1 MBL fold metallo-hydrolase [Aquihabitans sp. G128]
MTTEVVLTGTGVPHPRPGRAGAGTLVRCGGVALQFDAGRATVLRLMEAGTAPHALSALFVTHVHSDHVVDLADVAMTRWIQQQLVATGPLVVVAPEGGAARFVERMLDPYDEDLALRVAHVGAEPIRVDLRPFAVPATPEVVWTSDDGTVRVLAVAVHHEPVPDAVAYRVETPEGVVVVSGDTRVCQEVEDLSAGADLLVHEACRATALAPLIAGTTFETIFSYHADTVALGAMAERAAVPHVLLTHLIPPPDRPEDADAFAQDLRDGGYAGRITVGEDLVTVVLDRS